MCRGCVNNLCIIFIDRTVKNSEISKCNQMNHRRPFSWGAGFDGFDQVRMFRCFPFCVFKHSLILHVIRFSIFGVDCVMDAKNGNLVTSIRQPIHGSHPLIGRSSTSSIGFYFSSSPIRRSPSLPFWMKSEEILFFQYSVGRRMCSSSWKT